MHGESGECKLSVLTIWNFLETESINQSMNHTSYRGAFASKKSQSWKGGGE